ncbi:hypothetical protein E1B28_007705 [Marasmius oreades]|uniref:Fungal-type protein kinase domain-containing protein n=1 Tax=Marasmius oreades TaxID=181124 RepID=A0A9P7S3L4_9AGAR|nr:uncharacterized protein E1B28_007705 [Marasmius oreades]KAG7094086.1 hypothetical protein E1B28_007705 [Marasmius oreades]
MVNYSTPGPSAPGPRGAKRKLTSSPREALNINTWPQILDDARDELVNKYKCIPEKSVAEFLSDHVPHVPTTVLEDVMTQLKKSIKLPKERNTRAGDVRNCTPLLPDGTVYGYKTSPATPAKQGVQEARAFRNLFDLITAILELAAQINGRAWVAHSSKQEHLPDERPNSSHPDSYFYLIPKLLEEVGWEQLLCIGEVKKKKTEQDALDNWVKIVWGMHHIMRNDPCRLFTFGYTMEDDQARLWYHSRSSVFVSKSFNWIEDPKPFITFILALVLANHHSPVGPDSGAPVPPRAQTNELPTLYEQHSDYLERIGIDPTMKRVVVGDSIQYEITVKGLVDGKEGIQTLVFVTKEVLCDFKVDKGTGRATRVWLVYDKDSNESIASVLKDVWLEDGAMVEGDSLTTLANLVEVDERQHSVPVKEWYRDHFLHMHTHEKLGQNVLGVRGKHSYIRLLPDPSASKSPATGTIHHGSKRVKPRGGPFTVSLPQGKYEFDKPDRFHYRIVFRGAMEPLESVRCRRACSKVVIGIFRACWVLWVYGKVHRDVSTWNAFLDPSSPTGRLGDFDYLVEYAGTGTGRRTGTGTPLFRSVEVEAQTYLHAQLDWDNIYSNSLNKPSIFTHNLLHDLESVFWVSLWTVVYFVDTDQRDSDASQGNHEEATQVDEERLMLYDGIFPDGGPGSVQQARRRFIGVYEMEGHNRRLELREYANHMPEKTRELIEFHFERLRRALVSYFREVEKDMVPSTLIPFENPAFEGALNTLGELLEEVSSKLGDSEYPVSPLWEHQFVLERELALLADPEDALAQAAVSSRPSKKVKNPLKMRRRRK